MMPTAHCNFEKACATLLEQADKVTALGTWFCQL
jgi:hypothetical protein